MSLAGTGWIALEIVICYRFKCGSGLVDQGV